MTTNGERFVKRMGLAARYMEVAGVSPFIALSTALEDDEWILVWAAACAMAKDITEDGTLARGA